MIALIIAALFCAYVGFLIGKKNGAKGKFFQDKNNDNIPDYLQKGGRPKGSKNKKK